MKITHNPPSEGRNWRSEMNAGRRIQSTSDGSMQGDIRVGNDGVVYLDDGRSVFSQPRHKTEMLVSERFWFCLGFAGQNLEGNYLGHIFPGTNINSPRTQMTDHGVEEILNHRADILRILESWRNDGLAVEDLGIFGGKVWKEGGGKGYLAGVQLLGALGKEVFGDEPKIIGLPTKGMVYGGPSGVHLGSEPQTVFVGQEGILIHTEGEVLESPITIKDVSMRIEQILS